MLEEKEVVKVMIMMITMMMTIMMKITDIDMDIDADTDMGHHRIIVISIPIFTMRKIDHVSHQLLE